jgi:thiamine biosynthesis lipoprotein
VFRHVEQVMGLPVSLDLRGRDPLDGPPHDTVADPLDGAVAKAFAWLHEVDRRFSPFRPDSEVCRVGRGELGPARYSPELTEIRALCAHYERASGGVFRAWLPGRSFDPSGVVKGWAVQGAARILRDAGATRFCLNAGGDVLTVGEPEPGRPWRVGIRHPDRPHEVCAVLRVRDGAVATSGTYERGRHVLDGRTGRPAEGLVSLTVVAADLTTADATATAAFAMGPAGIGWADAQPGCLVYAVDAGRRVHRSEDLTPLLTTGDDGRDDGDRGAAAC